MIQGRNRTIWPARAQPSGSRTVTALSFSSGETTDWLDRTVNVPTLSSLSLKQWLAEFDRLKKLTAEIMGTSAKPAPKRKRTKGNR